MKRSWAFWRIPLLCAVMALCAMGIVMRQPQALPLGVYATPTPSPTPTPYIPPPTPIPTPVPGAITIISGGDILCTMASEEDAEALVNWQLGRAEAAMPKGHVLQRSAFEKPVASREARVGEMPVTLEQAQAMIENDSELLRAYIVTRETINEIIPFETEQKEDKRIPHGARIVRQVGRTGLHSIITTHMYCNGEELEEPVVEESTLEPVAESILVGAYIADTPDGNPGRSEGVIGPAGPEGFPLSLPVDSSIISNFGTRARTMHYGVDFSCKVDEDVFSPGNGVVMFAGQRGAYGTIVEIHHGNGFVVRLSPLKELTVMEGAEVTRGQKLGVLAPPEDEEQEPHLHMELLIDGIPYNPRQYLN